MRPIENKQQDGKDGKSNHCNKYIQGQCCKHPLQKGLLQLQLYAVQKRHTLDLKNMNRL